MPRGTQFGQLVDQFREEAGHAVSRALGQNELPGIKAILRRTYRRLHSDFEWPHLRVYRDKTLAAGEQYYALPADLLSDRIAQAWVREQGTDWWYDLIYGIGLDAYNTVHSFRDEREDFPCRWQVWEEEQFEVWPVPATSDHTVRFYGVRAPKPLTDENETVDLDDDLIVLYAVAEMLARERSSDAELKLQQARQHYMRLRSNSQHTEPFTMKVSHDRRGGRSRIDLTDAAQNQ